MTRFLDYRSRVGTVPQKFFKASLFRSDRLLLGLNCLEAGQTQPVHLHAQQDKFYLVLEGEGRFVVGDETRTAGPGMAVWAPAGVQHGVRNDGAERLVLLVGIAPAPAA